MRVNLIRRRIIAASVEGEPAQWIWEVAVTGEPNEESGMILSLTELDGILLTESQALHGVEISSACQWFEERARACDLKMPNGVTTAWQRLISDKTMHVWRCEPDKTLDMPG